MNVFPYLGFSLYIGLLLVYLAINIAEGADDAVLAKRIKGGDHVAFKQFFDRYHSSLLSYLSRRGLAPEAAEDIVQNAYIFIWERRNEIDESKSLRAFLFRIGYTRALNHFRDTAKFDGEADLTLQESTANTSDSTELNMANAHLRKAIQSLPEKRRAVFELCFLEDLTYREAAETLGISIKTVENQMAHALKTIRAAMQPLRQ